MEEARKLSVQIRIKEELERLREQVKFGRICRFENCMDIDMRLNMMVGVFCISYSYCKLEMKNIPLLTKFTFHCK